MHSHWNLEVNPSSPQNTNTDPPIRKRSISWVWIVISIIIQVALGLFLGHVYDMRISMATGYLVATGQNPYVPQNLVSIFNNPVFQDITSIGYPPPWPILLGLIYLVSFKIFPNLLVYNLAIKIPIIAANITLVFLVGKILQRLKANQKSIRIAQVFLLFNPFLLLTTSAWGQIDSIVALLVISSLLMLDTKKFALSAILLGTAISFKPIALPVLPVVYLFVFMNSRGNVIRYLLISLLTILILCITPYFIFGWNPTIILQHWNAHLNMNGGLSWITVLQPLDIPNFPFLFGWPIWFLWVPALGIATWFLRRRVKDFTDLIRISIGMVLLFYVTRTWVSEPNINLILPLLVILTSIREMSQIKLTLAWALPLVFSFFNVAIFQLLFLSAPTLMTSLLNFSVDTYSIRKFILAALSIGWLVFACLVIRVCFKPQVLKKTMALSPQGT